MPTFSSFWITVHRSNLLALLWSLLYLPSNQFFSSLYLFAHQNNLYLTDPAHLLDESIFPYSLVSGTSVKLLVHSHRSCKKALQEERSPSMKKLWRISLPRNIKKSRVPDVFIKKCAHNSYFNFHILTFTLQSTAKIWIFF